MQDVPNFPHMIRDAVGGFIAATGLMSFPYWADIISAVTGTAHVLVSLGGVAVMWLTISKLRLDIQAAKRNRDLK